MRATPAIIAASMPRIAKLSRVSFFIATQKDDVRFSFEEFVQQQKKEESLAFIFEVVRFQGSNHHRHRQTRLVWTDILKCGQNPL